MSVEMKVLLPLIRTAIIIVLCSSLLWILALYTMIPNVDENLEQKIIDILKREHNLIVKLFEANRNNKKPFENVSINGKESDHGLPEDKLLVLNNPESNKNHGDNGEPVLLRNEDLNSEQLERKKKLHEAYEFNAYISEMISLHRQLPDQRDKICKIPGRYNESSAALATIIICFHNEHLVTLLRSIYSILERSPESQLQEIILIDDFSNLERFPELGEILANYILALPKVRLIRLPHRQGLIRARIEGAKLVKADYLIFLDSHIECFAGWFEPLVDYLYHHPRTAVAPIIESINDVTFAVHISSCEYQSLGSFNWLMGFDWGKVPDRIKNNRKDACDPIPSPTMAGGLFAIKKKFFTDIGYYDAKLDVWGAENLEISFKTWMCGDGVFQIGCSHVGHIFRRSNPYARQSAHIFGNFVKKNCMRVAVTWLDDKYLKIYMKLQGLKKLTSEEYGDITDVLSKKKELKCKSFEWYLSNVYPEMHIPGSGIGSGEIRSMHFRDQCLDSLENKRGEPVGLYQCHKMGGNQYWDVTTSQELRNLEACVDFDLISSLRLKGCIATSIHQKWMYNHQNRQLLHVAANKCLGVCLQENAKKLCMLACDPIGTSTQWEIEEVNVTALNFWHPTKSSEKFFWYKGRG